MFPGHSPKSADMTDRSERQIFAELDDEMVVDS